jgi:hypothetical protein
MFESQITTGRKRPKKRRKEKGGVEGALIRSSLLSKAVEELEMNLERYHLWWTGPPEDDIFKPAAWGAMHRENIPAIFTMAVVQGFQDVHLSDPHDLILWLGTCRRFFEGDIVIAIEGGKNLSPQKKAILKHYNTIVYEIPDTLCSKAKSSIFCGNEEERAPASVFRYYFYEKWSANYNHDTLLMLADYRDILFQSNPFHYHLDEWFPEYQLAVFDEFYPNMVINRCRFNSKLMKECYGDEAIRNFGSHTIISSGAIMGQRDAIMVWSHHMTSQLQEAPGRVVESAQRCISGGIDHAFINYLVYSKTLKSLLKIKQFPQGSGSVNSLGGLNPDTVRANITGSLHTFWTVLNDEGMVLNWNGEVSPVVHQLDHFIGELEAIVDAKGHEHNNTERGWAAIKVSRCLWGCKESPVFV